MATVVSTEFLGNFSLVFTFLLAYVIVYGILEMTKPFGGEKKGLHALVAAAMSLLVVVSPTLVAMMNFMVPWFLILILFIFFVLFILKMFGGEGLDYTKAVTEGRRIPTIIIIVSAAILIFGLANALGNETLQRGQWDGVEDVNSTSPTSTGGFENTNVTGSKVATTDFETNVLNTLVNPKVLGLIMIMMVAVFAMFFLSD
ncbi:hypothetical protein KY327_00560 [Candidatus Woesearchaeota archaeon]|nr:hypothetical protein [Candidatus Woesearchaeota archaeon]